MRISKLTTEKRVDTAKWSSYKIIRYGTNNDAPQKWQEAASASGTASSCINRFATFIEGGGFTDTAFYKAIINPDGLRADRLLRLHSADLARFSGFAIHVNYNALYQIVSASFVPFETVRFSCDEKGNITGLALHPDWGKRNTAVKTWDEKDIVRVNFYNPDPKVISAEVKAAGSWDKYNGQIMYVSMAGDRVYPAPVYDPVISDVSTEDAIASVKNRNAKNNFLPAGMLVTKAGKTSDTEDSGESTDFADNLTQFQGAEKACKIIHVETEYEEEKPEFIPFDSKNYDKEFDYSEGSVQGNIGRAFMQPPVLRGELVAGRLGTATEIKDATDFYNMVTSRERRVIEEVYTEVFNRFIPPVNLSGDYSIIPITFAVAPAPEAAPAPNTGGQ